MFGFFFGWRKASKCKKLIKRVQCRLKLLKNKRCSMVRQAREDLAQLIKIGREDIAFNRAEELLKDENLMEFFDLLDSFCEFIIINLSYIRKHKDLPNDINEAVSSLIYASARCGDLPELRLIRKLFGERYGERFEATALELMPGNLVNIQVKEKLSVNSLSDNVKQRLVDEISRDHCLKQEILALEYITEVKEQVKEQNEVRNQCTDLQTYSNGVEMSQIEASNAENKAIINRRSIIQSNSRQDSDKPSTCLSSSIVLHQSSPDTLEIPLELKAITLDIPKGSIERKITASSSESLPQFPDEMIVYLDDIEEVQPSISNAGSCQDQRIFKFKSPVLSRTEKTEDSFDVKHLDNDHESSSERSRSSRPSSSSRKKVNANWKRPRRRSVSASLENSSSKDFDWGIYYDKPRKRSNQKHRSYLPGKPQKQRPSQPTSQCFSSEVKDCRLSNPSYFRLQRQCSRNGESEEDMELCTFPERPRSKRSVTHDIFTISDCQPGNSCPEKTSPRRTRKETRPPYLRAWTMPQERSKESHTDNILRTSMSFPVRSPNHVHPKLPDYDDLAAKFMALKKEYCLQNGHK